MNADLRSELLQGVRTAIRELIAGVVAASHSRTAPSHLLAYTAKTRFGAPCHRCPAGPRTREPFCG